MHERNVSGFCTLLLALSFVVRLLVVTGVSANFDARLLEPDPPPTQPVQATLRLWPVYLSAVSPLETEPEAADKPPPVTEPLPREPALPPLTFDPQEAEAIPVTGGCTYPVDKAALLTAPSALTRPGEEPAVLIVHTHTSEAYTQEAGWFYDATESYRTSDQDYSVVRVGREIAQVLEESGIAVLHHMELNDYPAYDGAYERMRQTIEGYLADYPSIQLVLDVHRDAAEGPEGYQLGFTAPVEGDDCAQVMLVVGTDQGGLAHPNWRENLGNALKLQALLNRAYPGLCRNLDLRTERFNQHLTPGSMLAEFGAAGNTLQEALAAGRRFGAGLAAFLLSLPDEKIS